MSCQQKIFFTYSSKHNLSGMLTILDNLETLTFRSVMGIDEGAVTTKKSHPVGPDGKKLKPCCACPETKRLRDACIIEKGEENCSDLIEAHKACMRSLGFNL